MSKKEHIPYRIESLSELRRVLGLTKPLHPLVMIANNMEKDIDLSRMPNPHIKSFYKISFLKNISGKLKYGQRFYDFEEGGMVFIAPNQVIENDGNQNDYAGYSLFFHPDFLLNTSLAIKIKNFGFFSYDVNETLHLSEKEKESIIAIFKVIEEELQLPIDDFSQDIVVTQIELLLHYCNRYYKRQFVTRKAVSNEILHILESHLENYFGNENSLNSGIPTVQDLAEKVHLTPKYLSDMLRSLTGRNAQQLIHDKLIDKAKELLTITNLSASEIAYKLGFEYSQSFSRFFKAKTDLSPLEFRKSFN
ncbi:helix-turn-helix domain-containing protein [Pedobacter endophyticus]|uniref:Helix-turn-helix transcriptional regulator n=1 Tax=Pedobacter endophyticus TaxID=2789740 RepID=A0A7U3Q4Z9_9SPHI|nr:helix-turn-helix transcriptional regulator [Pedobacter endophyticus]QPH38701.1 helix-turn-helix transcriptional regulator [Pedobacter endophyticus]